MPTTKTVTAYTFDELSEQAKDKAREWMREQTFSDTDWAQFVEEDAEQAGAKLIEWDADRGAAKVKMDDPDSTAEYILTNHGKQCDTWTAADNYTAAMTEASKEQDDDERGEAIEMVRADFYAELGAAYGATMRKEYEYRQSDEATDEDIRANDYLFTEEGRRSVTL